mgnify:CR=1 FL=1
MPWDKAKKTEGEVLKEYALSNGVPSEKILVTKNVENLTTKISETTEGLLDNKFAAKAVGAIVSAAKIKRATSKGRKKKAAAEE